METQEKEVKQVQTRSDSKGKWSGVNFFATPIEAVSAFEEDNGIWKISWDNGEDRRRFVWTRPIYKKETNLELHLRSLSEDYKTSCTLAKNAIFWIENDLMVKSSPEAAIKMVVRHVDFREMCKVKSANW